MHQQFDEDEVTDEFVPDYSPFADEVPQFADYIVSGALAVAAVLGLLGCAYSVWSGL